MRKEILFKKGIITALTVAMVTSLAPVIGAGGLKTITAKAEGTESHNYNSQGFCTECDAYQSAVLTTDKYVILTMIIARTMCTRLEMQVSFSGLQDL